MAVEPFDVVDLIKTKRDKGVLSKAQIDWLVDAYTRGYVADEQMSAMTMAIFLNGMEREEIRDLTLAMIASGETRFGCSGVGSGAIVVSTTVVRRSVDVWLVDGCVSGSHVTVVRTGVGATSTTVELRSPTHS